MNIRRDFTGPTFFVALCSGGAWLGFVVVLQSLTWLTIAMGAGLAFISGWITYRLLKRHASLSKEKEIVTRWFIPVSILIPQGILLILFVFFRTDRSLVSPWDIVPWVVFPLYAISVFTLLLFLDACSMRWQRVLLGLQAIIAGGVTWIVYALGFGYDPFVHHAAERYLATHGFLSPPSLLYAGQYGLIATLTKVTTLRVEWFDQAFVPLLSAFVVLVFGIRARQWWSSNSALLPASSLLAVWLVPFLPLTFTVPHNSTYVLLLAIVFLLPIINRWPFAWIGGWIVCFALLIHPLLGVPIAALFLSALIARRWPRLAGPIACTLVIGGLLAAFLSYARQVQGTVFAMDIVYVKTAFRILFAFPFVSASAPWWMDWAYRALHVWPLLFILIGYFGLRDLKPEERWIRRTILGTALGMITTAFVLAGWIRLPNILSNEQFEFALRLRYAIPILFIPGVMRFFARFSHLGGIKKGVMAVLFVGLALGMWYGSYPQQNRLIKMHAPGLGRSDMEMVQLIERTANGRPYAALTPQMVSAAALRIIGFERELQTSAGPRYPYAIPTGGELYGWYLQIWRVRDYRPVLQHVFAFSQTEQIFLVLPNAWDPNGVLDRALRVYASDRETISDRTMTMYRFTSSSLRSR